MSGGDTDKERPEPLNLKLEMVKLSSLKDCPPIALLGSQEPGEMWSPYPGHHGAVMGMEKYLLPAKINTWAIVILFDERRANDKEFLLYPILRFADDYTKYSRRRGISIDRVDQIIYFPERPSKTNTIETMDKESLKSALKKLVARLNNNIFDHAIIILPDKYPLWVRSYLQYLETTWLLLNPCIEPTSLMDRLTRFTSISSEEFRRYSRYMENTLIPEICLKCNAMLGGVNVALKQKFKIHTHKFLGDGYLFLSLDLCKLVSRQRPFKKLDIAAAVGMWNLTSAKMSYRSQTRAQRSSSAVTDIDSLVRDIIQSYAERKDGSLPTRIIILRSITDEDKLLEVAQKELASIKKMLAAHCKSIGKDVPRLTCLGMTKGEKISRGPDQQQGSRWESSPDMMTLTFRIDIPIIPHYISQRLVRNQVMCSKALKVYDENEFDMLDIETMIHSLSFLMSDSLGISPTPIELASLANERTRHICAGWLEDNRDKYKESGSTMLDDLNEFLMERMGDSSFREALYYI